MQLPRIPRLAFLTLGTMATLGLMVFFASGPLETSAAAQGP